MKITLVRHGQTEYNKQNRVQGSANIPLNDEGRRQCYKIKPIIREQDYDICFSSPLIRTMETAMILVGDKVEIIRDNRLLERGVGELDGHDRSEYDYKKYWDYALNSGDNGVEPIQDVFNRCTDFLNYISEKYSDKSILVVTHGAVIRCIHHILNDTDLTTNLRTSKMPNCYIETIDNIKNKIYKKKR